MNLQIQPLVALCDEKVSICLSELPSHSKVKISAYTCLPWAPAVKFRSFAVFTTNATGCLDLSKQKPDHGSYDFVDSMGLIESLKPVGNGNLEALGQNISVDKSQYIDIVAECGEERAMVTLERLFMTEEVKHQKITDEFVGELFYPQHSNNKTIVNIGGSSGDLAATFPMSALLASRGFNVLSVAYFKEKGLPPQLAEIPLDYFDRVFKWLAKNPITRGTELDILGGSKGGELALLLASRHPFVSKVAAFAPHGYCFQGINYKNVSSWTYEGNPIPYIRVKNLWVILDMLRCFIKNEPFGYARTYQKALNAATNKEDARIKVENARADILLFAGTQDNMWNSYDGCVEIMEALRTHHYEYDYDFMCYDGAGHPFYAPYIIPAGEVSMKMAPRLTFSMGGTMRANAYAQADSWEKVIDFFTD